MVDHGGQNRRIDDRPRLLRVHYASNIEAGSVEELVGVQLFESGRVYQFRFHITRNGND